MQWSSTEDSLPSDLDTADDSSSGSIESLPHDTETLWCSSREVLSQPLQTLPCTIANSQDDLLELFSVPRVVPAAVRAGLRAEVSMDIACGHDLRLPQCRAWALEQIHCRRPRVIISSPPCTMFSSLMNMNRHKMDPAKLHQAEHEALELLHFSLQVGLIQLAAGRGYIHEHPLTATSWRLSEVLSMTTGTGSTFPSFATTTFDQCRFNLRSPSGRPLKKPTRLMYCNLTGVDSLFSVKCKCAKYDNGLKLVRHMAIMGNDQGIKLSRHAQHYPPDMVDAFVRLITENVANA